MKDVRWAHSSAKHPSLNETWTAMSEALLIVKHLPVDETDGFMCKYHRCPRRVHDLEHFTLYDAREDRHVLYCFELETAKRAALRLVLRRRA